MTVGDIDGNNNSHSDDAKGNKSDCEDSTTTAAGNFNT